MEEFLKTLREQIGEDKVITDVDLLAQVSQNSLGVNRRVPAILFPKSEADVLSIVKSAGQWSVPLYPLSRGRNRGYGDMTPVKKNQVVVSLERMSRILDLDIEGGTVTIEPGVSQGQLVSFLRQNAKDWMADVTGASPEASLVGNTLDGGFGHTPLGNHRDHLLSLRAVLGSGEVLHTGRFPTMGPNLAPLFIQSNFGIVTALQLPLFRRPEVIVTYTLQISKEENYLEVLPVLRELRQLGVIRSLPHFANATRIFMSTNHFPPELGKEQCLSDADCRERLKIPLMRTPLWAGVGGLYGSQIQVKESMHILKTRLGKYGQVKMFNPGRFKILRRLSRLFFFNSPSYLQNVERSLSSLEDIYSLCEGIPSARPNEHIQWKTQNKTDLGLIWICPVIRACPQEAEKLLRLVRPIFEKFRFELPITMTLIDEIHLVCVLNISFDKSNQEQLLRAHRAYRMLHSEFRKERINCYRNGIVFQGYGIPKERLESIQKLKRAWDPQGIIAPGRYGIRS
ncbi:MAG: FAD-binding oxidoreductase [Deltaproteobacteria bacterium]|nr:FAD-binding oxidoreductase [Deltaproteobacteria bacterium]